MISYTSLLFYINAAIEVPAILVLLMFLFCSYWMAYNTRQQKKKYPR